MHQDEAKQVEDWRTQFPWAKDYAHNDLFRPGEHAMLNACIGTNGGPYDLIDYAEGYFQAGRRLVESLLARTTSLDVVIYPLVFVHRHAIELALKHLATVLPLLWGESVHPRLTHGLLDNWRLVIPYLQRDPAFEAKDTVSPVDRILSDFVDLDPKGEAFRFPSARNQSLFLQQTTHINVAVFAQAMEFVRGAFEHWSLVAVDLRNR